MAKKYHQSINITPPIFVKTRGEQVRKIIADMLLGLFIIAIGIGYLGNQIHALPWENFTVFFPGWGSLFLIVPAIYWLVRKPFSWFWPITLLIGVLILLANQEQYTFGTAAAIVLAAFVILVGLRIILSPLFKCLRRRKLRRQWSRMAHFGDVIFSDVDGHISTDGSYNVSFGDRNVEIDDEFTSATLSVSFGEMRFDLSRAHISDCAVIDATCSFGELNIILPAYVRAELGATKAFSDVENHHATPADPQAPTVYINAGCSFGEIHIH